MAKKKGGGVKTQPKPPERGQPGYDEFKDRWWVGFQIGGYSQPTPHVLSAVGKKAGEEIDAYDFYSDPDTGMRPGQNTKPSGGMFSNLDEDAVDEHTALPPIGIWKDGEYLTEMVTRKAFMEGEGGFKQLPYSVQRRIEQSQKNPVTGRDAIWSLYLVSGEGTTGNNVWRVYELPEEIAKTTDPKHPLMWDANLKKSKRHWSGGFHGLGESHPMATPTKPAEPPKPKLPAGVRMRCEGCGHWFKMDDLVGHQKADLCPARNAENDWALMCDSNCGCTSLDQVTQCKPGFPREKTPEAEAEPEPQPSEDPELAKT